MSNFLFLNIKGDNNNEEGYEDNYEDNENYETFLNYCTMLGLSPSRIQEKVRSHLNPKLTTKQKNIMKGLH